MVEKYFGKCKVYLFPQLIYILFKKYELKYTPNILVKVRVKVRVNKPTVPPEFLIMRFILDQKLIKVYEDYLISVDIIRKCFAIHIQ
jgi:hypothetical protein